MQNQKKEKRFSGAGERLRQARHALGFRRQDEFGKALGGFTLDQISRVERGSNLPSPRLLTALARFGINANWILTGEGAMRGIPVVGPTAAGWPLAPEEPADVDLITRRIAHLEAVATDRPIADRVESTLLLMTAKRLVELERQVAEIVRRIRELGPPRPPGGDTPL
ncbi:MAG TPA: helix-turn-helix domain-containing protein [Phycisphaerae bacterium]|nr:helix-turn-helix domain-containing protein [Phycisphaerae bacterium]